MSLDPHASCLYSKHSEPLSYPFSLSFIVVYTVKHYSMPLSPMLRKHRQGDCYKFGADLDWSI